MRRTLAIGTLGLMVLLAAGIISWAQDAPAQGSTSGQGQHQMGPGGQHQWGGGGQGQWGGGQRRFAGGGGGQYGMHKRAGGFGGQRMGMGRGGGRRMGMRRGGQRGFGGGAGLLRMAENPRVRTALGLSDEQVARLHKIGVDAQKASVQTRADMQLHQIELRELMRADNPDHDAIMAKLDQVNALQGKMQKARVETMLSARGVLTADQIKKVKTFMENRGAAGGPGGERMMQRRGRPGGQGGAPGGSTPKPQEPPVQ